MHFITLYCILSWTISAAHIINIKNTKVVGIQVGLCSICCDILYFISRDTLSFCVQSYLERSDDEGDVKARLS